MTISTINFKGRLTMLIEIINYQCFEISVNGLYNEYKHNWVVDIR